MIQRLSMHGNNKFICIAGKNRCAIDFLKYTSSKIQKKWILVLPNKNDNGKSGWQPSLKEYALKNRFKITNLRKIYNTKNLIFISIEYENIIDVNKFSSKELYNFHFSLLPKFRGCHTNFYQIYYGEKETGVTLHKIDNGIDTGEIISKIKYKIKINDNALTNYKKLMKYSFLLFKKNFRNILNKDYTAKKQNYKKSSYFSRKSINYKKMKYFKIKKMNLKFFNQIKAFIFPPFQLPIVNNRIVKDIKYNNKKFVFFYD